MEIIGLVMRLITTERRKYMILLTKDTTTTKHTREQMLALADAVPRFLQSGNGGAMNYTGIDYGTGAEEWRS